MFTVVVGVLIVAIGSWFVGDDGVVGVVGFVSMVEVTFVFD